MHNQKQAPFRLEARNFPLWFALVAILITSSLFTGYASATVSLPIRSIQGFKKKNTLKNVWNTIICSKIRVLNGRTSSINVSTISDRYKLS